MRGVGDDRPSAAAGAAHATRAALAGVRAAAAAWSTFSKLQKKNSLLLHAAHRMPTQSSSAHTYPSPPPDAAFLARTRLPCRRLLRRRIPAAKHMSRPTQQRGRHGDTQAMAVRPQDLLPSIFVRLFQFGVNDPLRFPRPLAVRQQKLCES